VSDVGLELEQERRRRRGPGAGCLAVLIAFAVLAGGGYLLFSLGMGVLKDRFTSAPDYHGTGTGSVVVEVKPGEAASDIGATLVHADVVKSLEAFTKAATNEPRSRGIQAGFYRLRHKMSAAAALTVLIDPANLVETSITFPEGWTLKQIVARLAKKTHFSADQYQHVLADPGSIGLPAYAKGNAEGYLFPATYQIAPDATPRSILTMMVDRYKQTAQKLQLQKKAAQLGYSAHDVMTVASLIQAEARFPQDFKKVSRVIYNRLKRGMPLQFDSTVHYAVGKDGKVGTSDSDRNVNSKYNTYKHTGLPPTPILAPGDRAIAAALDPVPGSWLYFVTTNPDTGVTKFATTYREHLRNKAEFDRWCAGSNHC
jgi:UPF0755 protein